MNITWTKMSGAGNSFWLAYVPESPYGKKHWARFAQNFCQKTSVDGLAILFPSKSFDMEWLFFNKDGSPAEMCGNAACCAVDYVLKKNIVPKDKSSFTLKTKSRAVLGKYYKKRAQIVLRQSVKIKGPFEIKFKKDKISYMFINSSVPHAVILLPRQERVNWEQKKALSLFLRQKTTHHKDGMNVSFYSIPSPGSISRFFASRKHIGSDKHRSSLVTARSFERGVEDFTPACGTGSLAVAEAHRLNQPGLKSVFVKMPGGLLEVGFHTDKKISLISPVKWLEEKIKFTAEL